MPTSSRRMSCAASRTVAVRRSRSRVLRHDVLNFHVQSPSSSVCDEAIRAIAEAGKAHARLSAADRFTSASRATLSVSADLCPEDSSVRSQHARSRRTRPAHRQKDILELTEQAERPLHALAVHRHSRHQQERRDSVVAVREGAGRRHHVRRVVDRGVRAHRGVGHAARRPISTRSSCIRGAIRTIASAG